MLDNFYCYNFQKNQYMGTSLILAYTLMSLVLDLTLLVLAVQKHLQVTNNIMLDNFYNYNFPRNKSLGKSLLVLHLGVLGAGLGPDGPCCPETTLNDQYHHA